MQVQQFTGVSYGLAQLELVYQLYEERTAYSGNSAVQAVLSQGSNDLNQLDFTDAAAALNQYHTVTWTGNASSGNWNLANWSVTSVVSTNSLVFAGTKNLVTNNNFAYQTQFNGLTSQPAPEGLRLREIRSTSTATLSTTAAACKRSALTCRSRKIRTSTQPRVIC